VFDDAKLNSRFPDTKEAAGAATCMLIANGGCGGLQESDPPLEGAGEFETTIVVADPTVDSVPFVQATI
jgi:hypothetical protein